ncbi:MAG: OB-fold protein [Bacteroidales bacterium]
MKKWIKVLIGLFILGLIGAALGYKFIYNKPHKDYEKAKADFSVTADDLFYAYYNNRTSAEAEYNGKVVELNGILDKIETPGDLTIAVFVMEEGMFGDEGIRCTMLPNHSLEISNYIGKNLTIKGFCTGYNDTDVILEKCSVIPQ